MNKKIALILCVRHAWRPEEHEHHQAYGMG